MSINKNFEQKLEQILRKGGLYKVKSSFVNNGQSYLLESDNEKKLYILKYSLFSEPDFIKLHNEIIEYIKSLNYLFEDNSSGNTADITIYKKRKEVF